MLDDGDLFEVANSLAGLVNAPVTIEDRDTVVVAYSGGDQDVDEARVGTILSRQVPVRFRDAIARAGVFERLERSDEVFVVDLPEVRMVPRAVVAVREQGRLVGSIWAAVGGAPTAAQEKVLRAAAPVVAAHLRSERERADVVRRERVRTVADLIGGGEPAEDMAARRLSTGPWSVIALKGQDSEVPQELWSAFDLHLSAIAPTAVCAPLGTAVFGVLPADAATRIMGDFVERVARRARVVVGIGSDTERAAALGESRSVAEQVADALLRMGRLGTVSDLSGAWVDVLAHRLEPLVRAHPDASPLARLEAYDAQHQAGLVDAVRAYLVDGETTAAAERLHVHPNTMRNRLRRAREACAVDLVDPDVRLALMVALRVRGPW
ncbi:MAG TPA: helix-turn-helix domain-containing protein [Marmoricola sp.]|jgi:hypothetical protein|nr:helix-turn-helix domain-containing protein [Marmoricola sp.]